MDAAITPIGIGQISEKEAILLDEYKDIQEMQEQHQPWLKRVGDDLTAFGKEQIEEGHRVERLGALLVTGATQFADRGRAMVLVLPTIFDEVTTYAVEHSWNGYQAASASAIAVGGVFAAWGWAVGRAFHYAVNAYPKTTEKFIPSKF